MSAGETFLGALGGVMAGQASGASGKNDSPQSSGMDPTFVAVVQLRNEVRSINNKLDTIHADYADLMTQYNALVERFKQGRADLLGTYRSKLAYRQVAHELSGKPYEEIDEAAQKARPNFDKEVLEAGNKQVELDKKAGITK